MRKWAWRCMCLTCFIQESIYYIFLEQFLCLRVCFRCWCLCSTCFILRIIYDIFLEQLLCLRICCRCWCLCSTYVYDICLRHRVTNCASVFDVFCSRNGLWRNSRTKALRMCRSLLGFSRLFTTSGNKCENEHGVGRCSCLYATWGVLEMGYQGVLEHRPWIRSTAVCVRRVLF